MSSGLRILRWSLVLLSLPLLFSTLPSAAAAQTPDAVADLVMLKGTATVFRAGRQIPVRWRLALLAGDRVRTAPGSKGHLRFLDRLKGSESVITGDTEFQVQDLVPREDTGILRLLVGAIRNRVAGFAARETFMRTGSAVIGIKGTDFITYVKRQEATEFIGVEGLIEATSRSRPDYSLRIGQRQWGEIVEGEKPKPPIHVPDELWFPALREFSFPGETPPSQ